MSAVEGRGRAEFVSQPDFAGAPDWRVMIGRVGGITLWAPPYWPMGIFGGARVGKTEASVGQLAGWRGPALVMSVRDDIVRITRRARSRRGGVGLYDPSGTIGADIDRCGWNPLDHCRSPAEAIATTKWLTNAARGPGLADEAFWYGLAAQGLWPHMYAAAVSDYLMADVCRWVQTQENFEVRALLSATGDEEALVCAEALWRREERARSSVYSVMEHVLEVFDHPAAMASATSGIDLDAFLSGPNTLYVCAPADEQALFAPLFTALVRRVLRSAYSRQAATGLPAGLLVLVDEAANIVRLDNLGELITTAAGTGVQLVTIWHDVAQIHARYGPEAETIIDNLSVLVALPSRDRHMAALLDGLADDDLGGSRPQGLGRLRRLARGSAVCVVGAEAPTTVELVTRFNAPDLEVAL